VFGTSYEVPALRYEHIEGGAADWTASELVSPWAGRTESAADGSKTVLIDEPVEEDDELADRDLSEDERLKIRYEGVVQMWKDRWMNSRGRPHPGGLELSVNLMCRLVRFDLLCLEFRSTMPKSAIFQFGRPSWITHVVEDA